jgi:hypothetical protein
MLNGSFNQQQRHVGVAKDLAIRGDRGLAMWISALEPYGDLISAIGALLVFFSWLATNILGERYRSAKDSYRDANSTWRLHWKLDSINTSVVDVAALTFDVLKNLEDLNLRDLPQQNDGQREWHESNLRHWELASTEINARQIDRGQEFCWLFLERSAVDKSKSSHVISLRENCREISLLKEEKDKVIARANAAVRSDEESSPQEDIGQVYNELRSIIDRFRPLMESAVKSSNERLRELEAALHAAATRTIIVKRFSVAFYIIGSILIIAGTVLSKLVH